MELCINNVSLKDGEPHKFTTAMFLGSLSDGYISVYSMRWLTLEYNTMYMKEYLTKKAFK